MYREFDSVILVRAVADLPADTRGAVVHVHANGGPYEVEFFDARGATIAVETVSATDIRPRGWDGASELGVEDPTPEKQARIARLMQHPTAVTGDEVDPETFYAPRED
ncbi:hypothetical protein GCM10023147_45610 [Tsukamurella soli]|uniref:DUF4926 domain-containing protein n=2 Tax=Tsukamurella soli TaxID=644556 RepID=A0ABP8KDA0_9ACTN